MKKQLSDKRIRLSRCKVVKIKTESRSLMALKTFSITILFLLELFLLIISYQNLMYLFAGYVLFSFLISLSLALYVLSSEKNSYSKTVWAMFLLGCFIFSWYIYLISEEKFIFRRTKRKYNRIICGTNNLIKTQNRCKFTKKEFQDCTYLQKSGNFNLFLDTNIEYFSSGLLYFDDIISNLKSANNFIFMEFFIISDGILLRRILEILDKKIARGVEVRIIYDDLGCHGKLSNRTKKIIKNMGIKILPYSKLVPLMSMTMNFRDHRKIIIIDGKISYTGGVNLADEYINERRMHGYWKDAGIKVIGNATDTFTLAFLRQWEFLTGKSEDYLKFLNSRNDEVSTHGDYSNKKSIVIPFVDGIEYSLNIGRDMYMNIISKASNFIYIMSPYFVPDDGIISALKNKAMSGVDVIIILPQIADKKYVYKLSISNAKQLLKYGVKIYLMKDSFVHSKVILTEYSAIVGSINMSMRSFYQQFESAVYSNDSKLLSQIKNDFIDTIQECEEKTSLNFEKDNFLKRAILGLLRIFSPLM